MRTSFKLFGAVAVAGLFAAGGSAFTASSTIDQASKQVGATSQSISGIAVTDVSYTWDSASDATSGVDFTIGSPLNGNDTLTVTLNGTPGQCTVQVTDASCTWSTPVVNANALSIVVN